MCAFISMVMYTVKVVWEGKINFVGRSNNTVIDHMLYTIFEFAYDHFGQVGNS